VDTFDAIKFVLRVHKTETMLYFCLRTTNNTFTLTILLLFVGTFLISTESPLVLILIPDGHRSGPSVLSSKVSAVESQQDGAKFKQTKAQDKKKENAKK
jgi:hypothetical protein